MDAGFADEVRKSKQPTEVWKRIFNLPCTDERYLRATETEILEDLVREVAIRHREEWESEDRAEATLLEFRKKRFLDPDFEARWKRDTERELKKPR